MRASLVAVAAAVVLLVTTEVRAYEFSTCVVQVIDGIGRPVLTPGLGLHLLQGSVTRGRGSVTLTGTVALDQTFCIAGQSVREPPALRYTLRNATVTLTKESASGPVAVTPMLGVPGGTPVPTPTGGGLEWGFVSVSGSGTLEVGVVGAAPIRVQDFSFSARPESAPGDAGRITFNAGRIEWNSCRYQVGANSQITSRGAEFLGVFNCAGQVVRNASLSVSASGVVSGGGKVEVCHILHDVGFSIVNNRLGARGTTMTSSRGWRSGLVAGWEVRVDGASSTIGIDAGVSGAGGTGTFTGSIDFGKVEVRTTATKPDGTPWVSAQVDPGSVSLQDGRATLALPAVSTSIPDVLASSRATCLRAADLVVDNPRTATNERTVARDECYRLNPQPPSIPSLPSNTTIFIDYVIQ